MGFFRSMREPLHGGKTHHVSAGIYRNGANFLGKLSHFLPPKLFVENPFSVKKIIGTG
jgi:hypothetical protein